MSRLGLSTNIKIIRALEKDVMLADVGTMVQAYLAYPEVARKFPSRTHFNPSLKIFVQHEFTLQDPSTHQEMPKQDKSLKPETLENVLQRLEDLRLRLSTKEDGSITFQAKERPQKYNRYNTVDQVPAESPPLHSSGRKYKYRQRYAIKTRSRIISHEPPAPPDTLKQYASKAWKAPPESPQESTTSSSQQKPKTVKKKRLQPVHGMTKKELVSELQWEHPTRTLDVGTVNANVTRVLSKEFGAPLQSHYLPRIKTCLSDVAQLAATLKRICQLAIGQYLEQLSLQDIDEADRIILHSLCPSFTDKNMVIVEDTTTQDSEEPEGPEENEEDVEFDDKNDGKNDSLQFFLSLLTAVHSSKRPSVKGKSGLAVCTFLDRAKNFIPPRVETGSGSKIDLLKKKGLLRSDAVGQIDPKLTLAENFIILNRACGSRRCLSPISSLDNKFITVSEPELTKIFWQDEALKLQLQHWAYPDFPSVESPEKVAQVDVGFWIGRVEPGYLINKLLTDIGGYSEEQRKKGYIVEEAEEERKRKRKLKNYSRSTSRMSIEKLKEHVQAFHQNDYSPASYSKRGYVLRGSIRTDGFRLQLLGFKLNELNCV
ncbi:hypothetical protein BG000_012074, partial [Podila horticola]